MTVLPKWVGRVVFVGLLAAAGGVMAEQGGGIPGVAEEGEMEQEATLSGPQQTAWAEQELERMQGISRRIQNLLNQARREHDIIKITCLNEKLTQINVTIRSFEERMTQHAESVQSSNAERRDHNYRIMVILAQRGRSLRSEAEACVGETDVIFGRTEVTTEIDPTITQGDPSDWPVDDLVLARPPVVSGDR